MEHNPPREANGSSDTTEIPYKTVGFRRIFCVITRREVV